MRYLIIFLMLTGCSGNPDRPNTFAPKKGPYCPDELVPVCEIRIGHTICVCTEHYEQYEIETEEDF